MKQAYYYNSWNIIGGPSVTWHVCCTKMSSYLGPAKWRTGRGGFPDDPRDLCQRSSGPGISTASACWRSGSTSVGSQPFNWFSFKWLWPLYPGARICYTCFNTPLIRSFWVQRSYLLHKYIYINICYINKYILTTRCNFFTCFPDGKTASATSLLSDNIGHTPVSFRHILICFIWEEVLPRICNNRNTQTHKNIHFT